MAVTMRPAESAADFEAWRLVRLTVVPGERAATVTELASQAGPQHRFFLAEIDGELAGSGMAGKADTAGAAGLIPRVLPAFRRQGVGSAMLRMLAAQAMDMGFTVATCTVSDPGSAQFAARFGFQETDREVEQVRVIGDEPAPAAPAGVTIMPVSARPDLWPATYRSVGRQAFADMATTSPVEVTAQQWEQDWITDPVSMFLALADGEVIGCAGLHPDPDDPRRAEQALTAVRRDWRGRGVASALKRTTLAWAASHGISEVYTWTQRGNDAMRTLNTHLGFTTRSESIRLRAPLPLP